MKLSICGQTCHLLPSKAVFWEEREILILSDIHIGKSTVFRKFGIAIPEGTTEDDLSNLMSLVNKFKPKKCVIVGDLIHAKSGLSTDVKNMFSNFLNVSTCETHLVMGNHDRHLAANLPIEWPLQLHKDHLIIDPFCFAHFPKAREQKFTWAGHLHPKVEVKNKYDRLVLRCFQVFPGLGILPAFGEFVGGTLVKKSNECQIYAIVDSEVIKL